MKIVLMLMLVLVFATWAFMVSVLVFSPSFSSHEHFATELCIENLSAPDRR